jgi:hypothetical protein
VAEDTVAMTTALELPCTPVRPAARLEEAREFIAVCSEVSVVPSELSWVFDLSFLACSAWNRRAGARSISITESVKDFQSNPEAKPESCIPAMRIKNGDNSRD